MDDLCLNQRLAAELIAMPADERTALLQFVDSQTQERKRPGRPLGAVLLDDACEFKLYFDRRRYLKLENPQVTMKIVAMHLGFDLSDERVMTRLASIADRNDDRVNKRARAMFEDLSEAEKTNLSSEVAALQRPKTR